MFRGEGFVVGEGERLSGWGFRRGHFGLEVLAGVCKLSFRIEEGLLYGDIGDVIWPE